MIRAALGASKYVPPLSLEGADKPKILTVPFPVATILPPTSFK